MRATTLLAVFALGCLSLSAVTEATAQSYYWHEGTANPAKASHVLRYSYNQPCQTLHKYRAHNLSLNADTVMHLTVGNPPNEIAWNDNFQGGSQITYFTGCTSGSETITIWVRAVSNMAGGDPDLNYTYTFTHERLTSPAAVISTSNNVPLGGWILSPVNTSGSDSMETVLTNNGAAATLLIRLHWDGTSPAHYKISAWDQSSGVGVGSKVSGTSNSDERWVIATPFAFTREGPVRVVRNDRNTADTDGDTLGNNLEAEACTCRSAGVFSCSSGPGYTCNSTANESPRDTDGDGLNDNIELLGIEQSGQPHQYLPWWGANPRRRDIFVEMDRANYVSDPPVPPGNWTMESTAIQAGAPYAMLTITNPDGTAGISTHFDIGPGPDGLKCRDENGDGNPTNDGDVDGVTRFCGQMGGANTATTAPTTDCSQDLASFMAPIRVGVFHWMIRRGVGNGSTPDSSLCSYISNDPAPIRLVAHELGHQLGLWHHGDNQELNTVPTYQSLMNYTYGDETSYYVDIGQSIVPRPQFSSGTLIGWPLNPINLSETSNYGGTVPLDFLTYDIVSPYDFDENASFPRQIDWNRDGSWDPSVRAHVVGEPNQRNFGGAQLPTQQGQQNLPAFQTSAATSAAYLPNAYTYVVATDSATGLINYTRKPSGFGWTSWAVLPSSPGFPDASSPSIATYQIGGVDKLFVFAAESTGGLRYARYDVNANLEVNWQYIAEPPGVDLDFREVNTTVASGRLYVVGVDMNVPGEVWLGWFEGATWNEFTRAEDALGVIESVTAASELVTPGIAAGPDGHVYLYVRKPASVSGDERMALYEYDPATEEWDLTGALPRGATDASCSGALGRISMVYRPHQTAAGGPVPSGNGALWAWYSTTCNDGSPTVPNIKNETFYRWTWGPFNTASQGFNLGKWHRGHLGIGSCNRVYRYGVGLGVGVVDHPDGIQAFVPHTPDGACPGGVWWVPHADGQAMTGAATITDFDDATFIRNNMCVWLHEFDGGCTKCAAPGVSCGPPPPFQSQLCYDDEEYVE